MNKSLWRILFGSIIISSILAILDLSNLATDNHLNGDIFCNALFSHLDNII